MVRTHIYGKEDLKQWKYEEGNEKKKKKTVDINVLSQENYKRVETYENNKMLIRNGMHLEKCSTDPSLKEGRYQFYMNKLSKNREIWSKDIKDRIKKFIVKNENKLKNKKGTRVIGITDVLTMESKDSLKKRKIEHVNNSPKIDNDNDNNSNNNNNEKDKRQLQSMCEIIEKDPIENIKGKAQIKEIKEIKGIEEIEEIIDMMEKEQMKQTEELMRSFIEREKEREREMIANGLIELSDMSMHTGNSGSNTLYESLIKEAEEYQKDRNRIRNIDQMKESKEFNNERIRYIFGILNVGIQKIEALKTLYRYYKNHFNKSVKEKMSKIHTFRYVNNENNFNTKFETNFSNENNKLNAIKKERLSRLFLYIEDINKIKQTLEMKHNNDAKNRKLNVEIDTSDNKSEYFYDAIENIDDFFIFDDTFQYCIDGKNMEHTFWQDENKSIFNNDRLDELNNDKEWTNETNNRDINVNTNNNENSDNNNGFLKFSLKDYYCFDLNKNLCYIHSLTPVIMIKKLAEKINAYNPIRNVDKMVEEEENEKEENDLRNENNKHDIHYYSHYAIDGGHNMDNYVQFHCEKWQENMYDIVEVNSLDVDFNLNCFKCNIMQIF